MLFVVGQMLFNYDPVLSFIYFYLKVFHGLKMLLWLFVKQPCISENIRGFQFFCFDTGSSVGLLASELEAPDLQQKLKTPEHYLLGNAYLIAIRNDNSCC